MSFKLPYSNQTNWGALVLVGLPAGPTVIGQAFGGGFYAGQISTAGTGVADYYLIVAPKSTGETSAVYKTTLSNDPGATSLINGPANSTSINDANHPAAQFCKGLTIGGFTDWYMPAKNELEICYYNLKPTTDSNNTSSGSNANAVPARPSNYTTGTPAQTSAVDFQSGRAQAFESTPGFSTYLASTQQSSTNAWAQTFVNGFQFGATKYSPGNYVRAVRRVPV